MPMLCFSFICYLSELFSSSLCRSCHSISDNHKLQHRKIKFYEENSPPPPFLWWEALRLLYRNRESAHRWSHLLLSYSGISIKPVKKKHPWGVFSLVLRHFTASLALPPPVRPFLFGVCLTGYLCNHLIKDVTKWKLEQLFSLTQFQPRWVDSKPSTVSRQLAFCTEVSGARVCVSVCSLCTSVNSPAPGLNVSQLTVASLDTLITPGLVTSPSVSLRWRRGGMTTKRDTACEWIHTFYIITILRNRMCSEVFSALYQITAASWNVVLT